MTFRQRAEQIGAKLQSALVKDWDGRQCILEMQREGSRNWKQMEWIGFYFEFLCQRVLAGLMDTPGPKYGKVRFDGLCDIPWDFKAHAINTSAHEVIVNDGEAIAGAIAEYGSVGLVLALGKVVYNDETRTFQAWHQQLKGGRSDYEVERIRRGAWSRLRKVSFALEQVSFIQITDTTLVKCGCFQSGFRNADGSPRRGKVLIDLESIDEETMHFVEF